MQIVSFFIIICPSILKHELIHKSEGKTKIYVHFYSDLKQNNTKQGTVCLGKLLSKHAPRALSV